MKTKRTKKTESRYSARVKSILSNNAKLEKTPAGVPAINAGVSMAPAKRSGAVNVCEFATAACIAACVLWFAGRTVTAVVRKAAVARTLLWYFEPETFYRRLHAGLRALAKKADRLGVRAFCRLNVASDIDHGPEIPAAHPTIEFYGYTKDPERVRRYLRGEFPANFHEAYSVHERSTFADVESIITAGGNCVVVIDSYYWGPTHRYGVLPERIVFMGPDGQRLAVETVDGDISDIRTPEFDGRGRAVCLRLKGGTKSKARARSAGFARPFSLGGKEYSTRGEMVRRGAALVRLA